MESVAQTNLDYMEVLTVYQLGKAEDSSNVH